MEGPLGDVTLAVERAAVEDHAAELFHVSGGREEASCGHWIAVRAVAERVGELVDRSRLEIAGLLRKFVRYGNACGLFGAWPEGGVAHAEGIEEALLHELLVGHSTDNFNDAGGSVQAFVGVAVVSEGLKEQRLCGVGTHGVLERHEVERAGLSCGLEGQAAGVGENFANEDGMVRRDELRGL